MNCLKKRRNHSILILILGYRQVTLSTNKHEWFTPMSVNLQMLVLVDECLAVFKIKEQELKAQYLRKYEQERFPVIEKI